MRVSKIYVVREMCTHSFKIETAVVVKVIKELAVLLAAVPVQVGDFEIAPKVTPIPGVALIVPTFDTCQKLAKRPGYVIGMQHGAEGVAARDEILAPVAFKGLVQAGSRRAEFPERHCIAVLLPMLGHFDKGIAVHVSARLDIVRHTNLLTKSWSRGNRHLNLVASTTCTKREPGDHRICYPSLLA